VLEGCADTGGRFVGVVQLRTQRGVLIATGPLDQDQLTGRWDRFCESGRRVAVTTLVRGVRHGCEWSWLCTGERSEAGRWTNGEKRGEWLYFIGDVLSNRVFEGSEPAPQAQGGTLLK
jgi:hypothetical protein